MSSAHLMPGDLVAALDGFRGRIVTNEAFFRSYERYVDQGRISRVYTVMDVETGELRRYLEASLRLHSSNP